MKIAASEGPFEGRCRPLIVALEGKETLFKCRHGRRASVLSQRHKVAPLISATRPLRDDVLSDLLDGEA